MADIECTIESVPVEIDVSIESAPVEIGVTIVGDGPKGEKGDTPIITSTREGKITTLKSDGRPFATINDGVDGTVSFDSLTPEQRESLRGDPGHTPVVTATKAGKVTTVEVDGAPVAEINDGEDGIQAVHLYFDDSVEKIKDAVGNVLTYAQIRAMTTTPNTQVTINYSDFIYRLTGYDGGAMWFTNAYLFEGAEYSGRIIINSQDMVKFSELPNVHDVKVNGASVVTQGVANIDLSSYAKSADLESKADKEDLNEIKADMLPINGGTLTGKLTAPQIETGNASDTYFQAQRFRGEGDASSYYHAIDFGYENHDRVDFYERGATWNFWKNTTSTATTSTSDLALGITETALKNKSNTFSFPNKSGTFALTDDIPTIPTKSSELINDSGYITADDIPAIPTKNSELTNDSGYITSESVSNPNLLDNWWFGTGVVNQRGKTSWAYSSSASNYGVDRWKLTSGSAVVTSNGITLNGTLAQTLETAVGTNVTASIVMHSGTATVAYNNTSKTFTITSSGGTIKAVKLEYGSVSTLANDHKPDYATELNKCLWYYERITSVPNRAYISTGFSYSEDIAYFPLKIAPKRIANPTVSVTNNRLLVGSPRFKTLTSPSIDIFQFSKNNGTLTLRVTKTDGFIGENVYRLGLEYEDSIEFSADT